MDDLFSKEFNDDISNMIDRMIDETEQSLLDENIKDKIQLSDLLLEYLRKMGRTPETYSEVIPTSFDLLDTSTKIRILNECMEKECTIEVSKIYNSSIEGNYEPDFYQKSDRCK